MDKKTKKDPPITSFREKMETPLFRKVVLLSLVSIALILDFVILGVSEKISPKFQYVNVAQPTKNPWEKNVRSLVMGTPMEKMIPYISRNEKQTAAFLVSIAKKESNLGKRSPRLDGNDCYNYWGYRDQSGETTRDGFTCFNSPKHAVSVVSKRIDNLIAKSKLDTPKKMVVWKCGWDCSWDNPVAVQKWIKDVDFYYQKFYE